jgi:hypothetical protein
MAIAMLAPPGGCGAVIFIFWSRNNPVKYTDPDGRIPIPWPLVIKLLAEWVVPAVGAVLITKALNDRKKSPETNLTNSSIVDTESILDTPLVFDATQNSPQISDAKEHHERKTHGKVENEINAELGRKLTTDELDRWHREIERATKKKVKNGEAPKGETNPSLSEEELREAARFSLGVEL